MTEPNITPQEFKRLKEQVTARMIQILTEEQGYSLEEAIDRVYTSSVYEIHHLSMRNFLTLLQDSSFSLRDMLCLIFSYDKII